VERVKLSSDILHIVNTDSTEHTWSGLIFAAISELERIKVRSGKLRKAIKVFKRNEKEGVPCVLPK
jgi:hypothetical protein